MADTHGPLKKSYTYTCYKYNCESPRIIQYK